MPELSDGKLSGMFVVAIAVVIGYWILVFKSRFGFRLRASGLNPVAARTSGIASNRMIVTALLLSGAVAGLIAMPSVLGEIHAYGQGVPDGLGFGGIAVALLGRNHPFGIVVAAILFGVLDSTAGALQLAEGAQLDHRRHPSDHRADRRHRQRGGHPPDGQTNGQSHRCRPRRSPPGTGGGDGVSSVAVSEAPDLDPSSEAEGGSARSTAPPARVCWPPGVLLLLLLSLTRVISGADDLTSSGTMGTTLRLTIPIMLAGLAGLWAERVGIVNIGIEGMMIFGTWFGAYGAWQWGPWVGLLLGILGGMLGGLIHAVATVRFNVDHVISGVALNLLAFGGMRYLSELAFVGEEGGGISQSPKQQAPIPSFDMPFLAGGELFGWKSPDMLGWFEKKHWFVISDVTGIARGIIFNVSWATVIGLLLVAVSSYVLWKTRFGLRLRSSGEAPSAAESLGVRIARVRYAGLLISGGFAGLGGAYLSIVASSYYRQGQTAGRGYIGLATMIFGNWRPSGVLGGATLFGFSEALKLRRQDSLTALFLFVSFVAGVVVILSLMRRQVISTVTGSRGRRAVPRRVPHRRRGSRVARPRPLRTSSRSSCSPPPASVCDRRLMPACRTGRATATDRMAADTAPRPSSTESPPTTFGERRRCCCTIISTARCASSTILELADDIGWAPRLPSLDVDELQSWFTAGAETKDLLQYLATFEHTLAVMQRPDHIERVAYEAVLDLALDGVVYAELRFAPELHDLPFDVTIDAVAAGFRRAERDAAAERMLDRGQRDHLRDAHRAAFTRGRPVRRPRARARAQGRRLRPGRRRDRLAAVAARRGARPMRESDSSTSPSTPASHPISS